MKQSRIRPDQPAPMEGGGSYNHNSRVQANGIHGALELVQQAAREAALPPGNMPLMVVDYGSSEGHNSMLPMGIATAALRERLTVDRPISVVHTDLPDNDFSNLFHTLESDQGSYLRQDPALYASAIGASFYKQILPPASVTLGWSSWSVQWLSRVPCVIPDHVQVAFSNDANARDAYKRQSAVDWRDFLTHRSREMRQGAQLVILATALNEEGEFGYRPLLQALYAELMKMADEGTVRPEEVLRMAIPLVSRSRADCAAVFDHAGCFEGLSLKHLEVFEGDDHIWSSFQSSGDAQAFGAAWAAFNRASVFPSLASSLEGGDTPVRRKTFFDRLESGIAARLSLKPEPTQIPLVKIWVEKL